MATRIFPEPFLFIRLPPPGLSESPPVRSEKLLMFERRRSAARVLRRDEKRCGHGARARVLVNRCREQRFQEGLVKFPTHHRHFLRREFLRLAETASSIPAN